MPSKPKVLDVSLLGAGPPGWGGLTWGSELSLLWEKLWNVVILQLVGCLPGEYRIWEYCKSNPPTSLLDMVPLFFFFPLIKNIYLFLKFGLCWISVAVWAFLYLQQVWAALHCGAEASHCCGFSHCAAPSLRHTGFIFEAHGLSSCRCQALEHWLNSGDTAA